ISGISWVSGSETPDFRCHVRSQRVRRGGRARKDIDSGAPTLRAADVDDGASQGGGRSRPVAINPREDATGPDCAHVERAAIVCHGRPAGPTPSRERRVTGMSEQAVLGGSDTSARDDVDIPRSYDDRVAIAAVVHLYAAPFNSGSRG